MSAKSAKTHRKDGSFRAGNKAHSLPPEERRVVLPAQRVKPETLATLQDRAKIYGGIGRAIDAAVWSMGLTERTLERSRPQNGGTQRGRDDDAPPATESQSRPSLK